MKKLIRNIRMKRFYNRGWGDSGSIGEELINDGHELERKCNTIKKVVEEDMFPLDYALEIYEVSLEDYNKFVK